jgi:hypothetical protein
MLHAVGFGLNLKKMPEIVDGANAAKIMRSLGESPHTWYRIYR